jgi:hypothetical protein
MNRPFRAAVALAAFAALPVAASAQITPGTTLVGTIDQSFNSKDAQVGQPFTMSNVHSTNYNVNGAKIYGHIADVRRAGQGTSGKIELAFDKVNTRSGNIYQIAGAVTSVKVDTKSNATKEALAAGGGALVGGLLGKGIGALIGGGTGYLVAKNNRENVTIPAGSTVTLQVEQGRRQATQ